MHLSGEKEASSPGPQADYWVLAEPGSDGHTRLSIATGSWAVLSLALIQNAAAPANRELKPARAASQLTAFMRQNGKSHVQLPVLWRCPVQATLWVPCSHFPPTPSFPGLCVCP